MSEDFKALMQRQVEISVELGEQIGELVGDERKLNEMVTSLQDGTIDPGDHEDITARMLEHVRGLPAYQALMAFTMENRRDLASLAKAMAECSEDELAAFIELQQKVAANIAVERMLSRFAQLGLVADRREGNPDATSTDH